MWPSIILYSFIGSVAMGIQDVCYTYFTRGVSTGRAQMAALSNALVDLTSLILLSFSGVNLTTKYGWRGWIGTIPVIIVAYVVTLKSTEATSEIEDEDEAKEDDLQDSRLEALERGLESLRSLVNNLHEPRYTDNGREESR